MSEHSLAGKRAIVTGAASGIGAAAARALVAAGAVVIGLDLAAAPGADFPILAADVADEASVASAVERAGGSFDILVNCAGIEIHGSLGDLPIAALDRMYAVNVRGPFIVTRTVLPRLKPDARIINVASELAYLGRAGTSGYCATKGAILSMTRSWARELGPGILVTAVAPGPIDTPLLAYDGMSDEQKALETLNPLQRIGRPDEVAAAIVFLAGPGATFITGQCIGVDGGAAMR